MPPSARMKTFFLLIVCGMSIPSLLLTYWTTELDYRRGRLRLSSSVTTDTSRSSLDDDSEERLSQLPHPSRNKTCLQKQNIAFLKVHKSGSTSVSNILQRFALKNKLNLVLPDKVNGTQGFNQFGRMLRKETVIPVPQGQQYNVLCSHAVYNRTAFQKLLPTNTYYIAIVRNLEDRVISALYYYGQVNHIVNELNKTGNSKNIAERVMSEFLKRSEVHKVSRHVVINSAAFDFGVPESQYFNAQFVETYFDKLDNEFGLVMVLEYFDESLILLKRRMCWEFSDIIYLKKNSNFKKHLVLSEKDRQELYRAQKADDMIYRHFYNRLWKDILAEGRSLMEEVAHFRKVLKQVEDFCESSREREVIEASVWSDPFIVRADDCRKMRLSEGEMVASLQQRARHKLQSEGTAEEWETYLKRKDKKTYNVFDYYKKGDESKLSEILKKLGLQRGN